AHAPPSRLRPGARPRPPGVGSHPMVLRMTSRTRPFQAGILSALIASALCVGPGCATADSEREKNLFEIYTNTAESYYQLGDHDRAIGQALKALEIEPDDVKL